MEAELSTSAEVGSERCLDLLNMHGELVSMRRNYFAIALVSGLTQLCG